MAVLQMISKCRCSVYADMLKHRGAAIAIAGVGAAQLIGSCFGVGLPCVFHQVSGRPCPGCGLTRSVLALLRGDVSASIGFHPFGPLLLLGLLTALVAGVLPVKPRQRLLNWVAAIERATGFTALILTLFMLTWGLRMGGLLPLKPV